jgi:hypothetical protein
MNESKIKNEGNGNIIVEELCKFSILHDQFKLPLLCSDISSLEFACFLSLHLTSFL